MANTELIEFLPDTCSPQPVPHTYGCIGTRDTTTIPNTYGFDLPANFGTTNATDTYFHAISDLVNGITYLYPPATTNPTTPVVCTDVAAIKAFLNSINSGITYTVNAFNEIVLTFANVGDENNWEFWLGTSTPDNYTNKLPPTLHDLQVDTQTYQQVQVVKFQQADGTFIDRFFVPSGDTLVEVSLKPENTFKFGNCPDCKKVIFATHDRYISVPGIPAGAVAYEMTTNLPAQGLDVSNAYIHLIYPILNNTPGVPIGAQLTDYFTNPQDGILWNDIAGVQAIIDFVLPSMNLNVGDVVYAINTDNLPIFFLSPTAVAELANGTYLHIYWAASAQHNNYDEKADVTVIAANPNILLGGEAKCVGIQEIKEKDTCTGEEAYRYVVENGSGKLVNASSVIANFDESKVLLSCPVAEEFDIKEREVCVNLDGDTTVYEVIKVYKRSKTTGLATLIHYESNTGVILTGDIVEVCCTCDSVCNVAPVANKVGFGYATSFNGRLVAGDRILAGEQVYLDYLEVDGNVLVNSPRLLGTTSNGFTATDMGYGIGYNKIIDLLNTVPEFAANGVRFITASAPLAPNGAWYDPMMWGVEYDDTRDVRIVIRDIINIAGSTHSYSIRLTADPSQTYDAIGDVVNIANNDWDINNVVNFFGVFNLQNITTI